METERFNQKINPKFNQWNQAIIFMSDKDDEGENANKPDENLPEAPPESDVITQTMPKLARPHLFKVIMLNDDYTPMDFVIEALVGFFYKSPEEAHKIMLNVHNKGADVCGIYTKDIAETKAKAVVDLARSKGHPLICEIIKA